MRKLKTMDGNMAAAHAAYAFSEVSAIYPITPSSGMAESVDEWGAQGRKNIFGEKVNIVEMESECGAAGALHGAASTGSYATTFTASQGLLLMIPNMYKLAGELLPCVFHVAARTIATHGLTIFGEHSDVMACRQTGVAMLASCNPQEAMDLGAVAHLSAIGANYPIMHFFDGFRTSHEQQKIEIWDYDDLKEMVDLKAIERFRKASNSPFHPRSIGTLEPSEIYFQHSEAQNLTVANVADEVEKNMNKVNAKLGTDYKLFNYYGDPEAEYVLVALCSVCDTAEETVDYLNAHGMKTGVVRVHLYRPFSAKHLAAALPKTVKRIAVIDRCKEPGAAGEPLYLDVEAALKETEFSGVEILRGRYGIGLKNVTVEDIGAAFQNMTAEKPKREFTLSIIDDLTFLSLPPMPMPDLKSDNIQIKLWGIGADGTVGASKDAIKIIGDHTDKKVQAYFQYDSRKSGGVTISHLRFGDKMIRSSYYVDRADYVACHKDSYIKKFDIVQDVKPGGIFLLNCQWSDEELEEHLPGKAKRFMAENDIQFYICNATEKALEIGLGSRINTILLGSFFKLIKIIPEAEARQYMKDAIQNTYGMKGKEVVEKNWKAVDAGFDSIRRVTVPAAWKDAETTETVVKLKGRNQEQEDYLNEIQIPMNALKGDQIPASTFLKTLDGHTPNGTSAFEKRGIAVKIPKWDASKCMQCNWCSYVCPHAVIRPFAMTKAEAERGGIGTVPMKGEKDLQFRIGISAMDCTGCGSCADVCPSREKALEMVMTDDEINEETQKIFDYAFHETKRPKVSFKTDTVKGTQFVQPYLEFNGACPGCCETPYAKLITQLSGDHMYIANATGCSLVWSLSAPSSAYTFDERGRGPAWGNSLFEDNAEFGYGMLNSVKAQRAQLKSAVERLAQKPAFAKEAKKWLDGMEEYSTSEKAGQALLRICNAHPRMEDAKFVIDHQDMLPKHAVWLFGGDGWAYDIGYGGLDHVLATGENINVLVYDTEVYSNTGGQASKATPQGARAQFADSGKTVKKKNLPEIFMSYGYIYVAQVAMGADPEQTLKAIREAESYDGPSIVIAYAPCINHGIKSGMNTAMAEMRNAVRAGYWTLLRYDPRRGEKGLNPLVLDSAEPKESYESFLKGENRYSSLQIKFPERSKVLFKGSEEDARGRYKSLKAQARTKPGGDK